MGTFLRDRITVVWLLLIGATLLSWGMGHGLGFSDPRNAGMVIFLVAFIKVRYVFLEFMEVRQGPLVLRIFVEGWVTLVCAGVLAMYWTGADPAMVNAWPRVPGL